jgi:hypothetical protein
LIYSVTQRFLDGYGTVKISASANDVTAHGDKEHNTATPSTEAVEALTAVAKAAAPTYGEGNIVAPRVTLSGDTAVTLDGETVVLGAGTAGIGKLTANSGVDIGDVDVTSLPAVSIAAAQTLAIVTTVTTVTAVTAITNVVHVDDNASSLTVDQGTAASLKCEPAGNVAHGASDSGNPLKIGGRAESSLATMTLVADGQRADFCSDIDGVQHVRPYCAGADCKAERIADTAGNSAAFSNFGAAASTRNYITTIAIFNSSATDAYVDFRDGTAGTILFTAPAPKGGGSVISFPVPLRQPTANTALAYDVSAAITTMYISVVGFQSKL